jgi:hypothetical protein
MNKRQSKNDDERPAAPCRYSQQERYLYAVLNGFIERDVNSAGLWLELLDHPNVIWCERWLLGNLDPAPLNQYKASLDLLVLCARADASAGGYYVSPGTLMLALMQQGYSCETTKEQVFVGVREEDVRNLARRQYGNRDR